MSTAATGPTGRTTHIGKRAGVWPDRRLPVARRVLALVTALGCLGVAVGCSDTGAGGGGGGGGLAGEANTRYVSGSGTVTTIPADERHPAPQLRGESLDGKQVSLSDFEGDIVVLNVWGSWCPPCRKEAPDLVTAAKKLRPEGVTFLGINTRDIDRGPAQAYVRRFGVPYPSIFDPYGEQLLGFRDTLPPKAIPSTLVIDRQGRIAARVLGPLTARTVEQLAEDVVESG